MARIRSVQHVVDPVSERREREARDHCVEAQNRERLGYPVRPQDRDSVNRG
jgi:hypothetical protein